MVAQLPQNGTNGFDPQPDGFQVFGRAFFFEPLDVFLIWPKAQPMLLAPNGLVALL